jgi:hypothetical protein
VNNAQRIVTSEFRDFDAFAEAVEDADLRFTLPWCETSLWQVTGVYLPGGMHVQAARMGSGSIAQGCTRGDGCNLMFNIGDQCIINGAELPPGSVFLLSPDSEFFVSGPATTPVVLRFHPYAACAFRRVAKRTYRPARWRRTDYQ